MLQDRCRCWKEETWYKSVMSQKWKTMGVFFWRVNSSKGWASGMPSAFRNCLFQKESSVLDLTSFWQTYRHPANSQHCEKILNSTQVVPFENNGCHQLNRLAWTKLSRLNWPLCSRRCFVGQTCHYWVFTQHSGWHCKYRGIYASCQIMDIR